jgi:FixJ family two-component response regulator
MNRERGKVYVVDDDSDIVCGMSQLIRAEGLDVEDFNSPVKFMAYMKNAELPDSATCILLDMSRPEVEGLGVQHFLKTLGDIHPVIFISSHGDVHTTVRAIKAGAMDFLEKPFGEEELISIIRKALEESRLLRRQNEMRAEAIRRVASLTHKEKEVLEYILAGFLNKQIADALDIVEGTVKTHRGRVMEKMGVQSVPDLVRVSQIAGVSPAELNDIL